MNLPKAIRVNNDILGYWNSVMDTESKEAIKLGIEALKREMLFRERVPKKEWSLLSGETKD